MHVMDSFSVAVKNNITNNLFNSKSESSDNPSMMFEQYKLVVDTANRAEDRRGGINNFFITVNGIFVPFLINAFPLGEQTFVKILILFVLTSVGLSVSFEWLFVMQVYKKLNYINHLTIKAFENKFPSYAFSIRQNILSDQTQSAKANAILDKELIIPKLFIVTYTVYFLLSFLNIWIDL